MCGIWARTKAENIHIEVSGPLGEHRKFLLLDFFQFSQEDHSFSFIAKNSGQFGIRVFKVYSDCH